VVRVECPAAHDQGDRRAYHDPVPLRPDQHVVEPETGKEMIGGEIVEVAPAELPHAGHQFDLGYVLRGNVAPGYRGATELLTRVGDGEDFATDACILKDGFDADGHRYLEEISFEIKHTQSEASLKKRARDLVRRGVRRVFAIHVALVKASGRAGSREGTIQPVVKAGPVKEWSRAQDDWVVLDDDCYIDDPCLRKPIKVRAFLDAVEADNAVARGLLERQNPVIVEAMARSYDDGKSDGYDLGQSDGEAAGLRQGIRALCQGFGIELTARRVARLDALGLEELRDLLQKLQEQHAWPD